MKFVATPVFCCWFWIRDPGSGMGKNPDPDCYYLSKSQQGMSEKVQYFTLFYDIPYYLLTTYIASGSKNRMDRGRHWLVVSLPCQLFIEFRLPCRLFIEFRLPCRLSCFQIRNSFYVFNIGTSEQILNWNDADSSKIKWHTVMTQLAHLTVWRFD